jgi:hypothetical protein
LDVWPAMLHYMFNGMLMDAVISVPILTIQYAYFYFFGSDPSWTVAMTLRVLHTCKMLCALRMNKIFEKFRKNNPGKSFAVSVASSITFIIALTHLFACLWMVSAGLSYTPRSDAFLRIFAMDDVDECVTGAHNCDFLRATCTNTAGSFTCTCHGGMVGNGTECYECPEYSSTFTRMTCRSVPCWALFNVAAVALAVVRRIGRVSDKKKQIIRRGTSGASGVCSPDNGADFIRPIRQRRGRMLERHAQL